MEQFFGLPGGPSAPSPVAAGLAAGRQVDRLLGEHGIGGDTLEGRAECERRMEAQRLAETDQTVLEVLREGWCLGGEEFRRQMLERSEDKLGEHHGGALRREKSANRAERIIAEELAHLGWSDAELAGRRKGDPGKMVVATRLRLETTLTVKAIAERLHLGTSKSANKWLHCWMRNAAPSVSAEGAHEG